MDVKKLSFSLTIVAILSLSLFVACGNGVPPQGVRKDSVKSEIWKSSHESCAPYQRYGQGFNLCKTNSNSLRGELSYPLKILEAIYTTCEVRAQDLDLKKSTYKLNTFLVSGL